MTKAEKIFKDTYSECRIHIRHWGVELNSDGSSIGFNFLSTEEVVCNRTCNDVQKFITKESKTLELDEKLGFDVSFQKAALGMVQATLNNTIKAINS